MIRDQHFGPVVAFGLGGNHVEIFGELLFPIAQLTDQDASEMVQAVKG